MVMGISILKSALIEKYKQVYRYQCDKSRDWINKIHYYWHGYTKRNLTPDIYM